MCQKSKGLRFSARLVLCVLLGATAGGVQAQEPVGPRPFAPEASLIPHEMDICREPAASSSKNGEAASLSSPILFDELVPGDWQAPVLDRFSSDQVRFAGGESETGSVDQAAWAQPRTGVDWALRARIVELEKKYAELEEKTVKKEEEPVTVVLGGRLEVDWATFTQDAANIAIYGNTKDGCQIRRARLSVEGEVYQVVDYQVEFEFADAADEDIAPLGTLQTTGFKTSYIGLKELPVVNRFRIGFLKEPMGLEWETSSRFIPFMERSMATLAFVPRRNLGFAISDWSADERTTWSWGIFRPQSHDKPPVRMLDHSGTAFTARLTRLPWYDEPSGGRGLFHLGFGYTVRGSDDHILDIDAREESKFSPDIVNTGDILDVRYWQVLGPEAAFVYGPFTVQSEFYHMAINRADLGTLDFNGYYAELSYFLTGENRRFDRRAAKFEEVVPFENFFRVRDESGRIQTGRGAWEIAYRHTYLDLESAPISGGRASSHTIGLNWYLNTNTRLMCNYILSRATPGEGNPMSNSSLFEFRAQIHF